MTAVCAIRPAWLGHRGVECSNFPPHRGGYVPAVGKIRVFARGVVPPGEDSG
jgi:hypothetical protein